MGKAKPKGAACPYRGAAVKHKGRVEDNGVAAREYPTAYACGTVTCPHRSPPIKGKERAG